MTILVAGLLLVGVVVTWHQSGKPLILLAMLIGMLLTALFYSPTSIEAGPAALIIHRALKSKVIPYAEIASVDRCFPSPGGLRLCGSGGFFGYWGYFHDIIIGSYFGYYGNRNECVLIKLKNRRQYVISCTDPDDMAAAIEERI